MTVRGVFPKHCVSTCAFSSEYCGDKFVHYGGGAALHHLQTESLSRDMSAPLLMQSLPDFTGAALETTLNLVQGNCSQHQLFLKKRETGILFFFGQTPLGPRTNISRLYFLKNSVSFAETTLTLQQDFQPICSLTIGVCFPGDVCLC